MKKNIAKLVLGKDLTYKEAEDAMELVMSGTASEVQVAAFLTALRMKGETLDELTAFASTMRKFSIQISPKVNGTLVDTCGTGGDSIKLYNVSTAAAFIAAGSGVAIAKHGNRSITSKCGSADVLEALGFNLEMPCAEVERAIEQIGVGFMFAPNFHPAMRNVAGVRREIGVRTVFNLLGPLTNPANAKAQLVGVYDSELTEQVANALCGLGIQKAMVVHGMDGLDEISTIGQTKITTLVDGVVSTAYVEPEDLGAKSVDRSDLEGDHKDGNGNGPTICENARATFSVLHDPDTSRSSPRQGIALVNAAAAILLGGRVETFSEAMEAAVESVESGSAYKKLKSLVKCSGGELANLEELENGRFS